MTQSERNTFNKLYTSRALRIVLLKNFIYRRATPFRKTYLPIRNARAVYFIQDAYSIKHGLVICMYNGGTNNCIGEAYADGSGWVDLRTNNDYIASKLFRRAFQRLYREKWSGLIFTNLGNYSFSWKLHFSGTGNDAEKTWDKRYEIQEI